MCVCMYAYGLACTFFTYCKKNHQQQQKSQMTNRQFFPLQFIHSNHECINFKTHANQSSRFKRKQSFLHSQSEPNDQILDTYVTNTDTCMNHLCFYAVSGKHPNPIYLDHRQKLKCIRLEGK